MRFLRLAALAVGLSILPIGSSPTAAQSVTIGNTDEAVEKFLSARGYSDIRVQSREFALVRAHACRNGEKFLVKVGILGDIRSVTPIGDCGPAFSVARAVQELQSSGYTQIDARPQGRRIVATACRDNRRYKLTIARNGRLIDRRRRGRCEGGSLTAAQVAEALENQGFDRVRLVDDQLPRYVARACDGTDRIEMVINRRGKVRNAKVIDRCSPPIDPSQLRSTLRKEGFSRIRLVNGRKAPYLARACADGTRYQVIVSKFGEVLSRTKLRKCRGKINEVELMKIVHDMGMSRIAHDAKQDGSWGVDACKGNRRKSLYFDAWGEKISEGNRGRCTFRNLSQTAWEVENRGVTEAKFFMEGCFKKRKFRWSVDRFGEIGDRVTLPGKC